MRAWGMGMYAAPCGVWCREGMGHGNVRCPLRSNAIRHECHEDMGHGNGPSNLTTNPNSSSYPNSYHNYNFLTPTLAPTLL